MFGFLKKILPPPTEEFFALFEEAANNCTETAKLFCRVSDEGISDALLEEARVLKQRSNGIAKSALRKLNSTFITPIDREDIQSLANLLNKITKRIVRACANLHIYQVESTTTEIKSQAANLKEAVDELIPIVRLIRRTSHVDEATNLNSRMKEIESKGDDILNQTMAKLFSNTMSPLDVMKYREIHKDIESALNCCYDVSDEVLSVVLKYS
ncbi:MAG: DUF47 family protein [Planctomycetaceae bacterium]|nr:DUF47 family protein [Planctomycetaceae bacterium]